MVERETGTRISRRWRGRADRGRIAGRSIDTRMRRVAVAVRDLLPACVPVRHAVAARSPRAARHAARWRVVGFSSRAVAADARSDWSRSRCRPLSRDQHETSSSHRDRDRVPRITATDDSAYDSARPPLSLRGCPQPLTLAVPAVPDLATCIFREMQGQGGMPGREDAAVRDQRRHESR